MWKFIPGRRAGLIPPSPPFILRQRLVEDKQSFLVLIFNQPLQVWGQWERPTVTLPPPCSGPPPSYLPIMIAVVGNRSIIEAARIISEVRVIYRYAAYHPIHLQLIICVTRVQPVIVAVIWALTYRAAFKPRVVVVKRMTGKILCSVASGMTRRKIGRPGGASDVISRQGGASRGTA